MPEQQPRINKTHLVRRISDRTGQTRADTRAFLRGFCDVVVDALRSGESVLISDFGLFYCSDWNARETRNPKTGVMMHVDGRAVPKFNFASVVKSDIADAHAPIDPDALLDESA